VTRPARFYKVVEVLTLIKHINRSHGDYIREVGGLGQKYVVRLDHQELIDYLKGKTDTNSRVSGSMDEVLEVVCR